MYIIFDVLLLQKLQKLPNLLSFLHYLVPREFCGNGIVERSEECDCGESTKDCEEQCCFPADHSDRPCQLKPRSWIVCRYQ